MQRYRGDSDEYSNQIKSLTAYGPVSNKIRCRWTYGNVFVEINIGAWQETPKLWQRNIPLLTGLLLSCRAFPVYRFPLQCLNKILPVSMVSCTSAILIKLMEISFRTQGNLFSIPRIISVVLTGWHIVDIMMALIGKTDPSLLINCLKTNSRILSVPGRYNPSLQKWSIGWVCQTLLI